MTPKSNKAFTLIELLTVIAIIGILAAIIIPTVSSVRTSANKAKSKVQFGQWASAIGLFKQDYGFYPYFTDSTPPPADKAYALATNTIAQSFVEILSGKKADGSALASGSSLTQNKRRGTYYSFSDNELSVSGTTVNSLKDAFENVEIYVMIDANGDGMVTAAKQPVRAGNATDGYGLPRNLTTTVYPSTGVRAGVLIYSAGKGSSDSDLVTSW